MLNPLIVDPGGWYLAFPQSSLSMTGVVCRLVLDVLGEMNGITVEEVDGGGLNLIFYAKLVASSLTSKVSRVVMLTRQVYI